tara:strand:+ start:147 stop:824 length:678 start_codon:yes stop_codon:yes gene_type:complete
MAGQRGFLYEGRVFNKLKSKNLVPAGVTPAGPDASKPDAVFLFNKQKYNLEVKLDLATDYGQGTLDYKNGAWELGGANTKEAIEMRKILTTVGAVKFANTSWGYQGAPNKGTVENKDITEEMVREDYRRFTDKFLSVPLSSLFKYYAAKDTYYIQIGGYGMYYMAANPGNLPVPKFNGALRLRIRLKRGGSTPIYNYRFTTALQVIQKPSKSKYDIDSDMDFLAA